MNEAKEAQPPSYTTAAYRNQTSHNIHIPVCFDEETEAGGDIDTACFRQYDIPLWTIRINSGEIPYSMIERNITI